jgi:hypothetical protein
MDIRSNLLTNDFPEQNFSTSKQSVAADPGGGGVNPTVALQPITSGYVD